MISIADRTFLDIEKQSYLEKTNGNIVNFVSMSEIQQSAGPQIHTKLFLVLFGRSSSFFELQSTTDLFPTFRQHIPSVLVLPKPPVRFIFFQFTKLLIHYMYIFVS